MGRVRPIGKLKVIMLRTLRPLRFAFALLLLAAGASHAQTPADVLGPFVPLPHDYFETAGRVRISQPIDHLLLPGGKRLFEDSGLSTDGGPGVKASGSGQIKNPSGNTVPVGASGRVSGSTASGAIGRAIPKLLKQVSGPLGVGMILYDLGKELGFTLSKDSSDGLAVSKPDPTVCTVSPCYEYTVTKNGNIVSPYVSTLGAAGAGIVAWYQATTSDRTYSLVSINISSASLQYVDKATGSVANFSEGVRTRSVAPSAASALPSSQQDFLDAVAAKSGWPSTSNLSKALADSVAATGEKVSATGTPTVTGPSSSPGSTTTTNNTTNNTTTTSATNYQHTYQGDTINTTTTTTNVTINNTTGDVIDSSTTVTESAPPAEPVETCGLPGKPACKIDETGTPDSVDADEYTPGLDDYKQKAGELTTTVSGADDKTFFASWSSIFVTPPLAACTPFLLPRDMGSLDPCPVVDGVRTVMAYIWAVTAFWLSLGMIRRVI